MSQSKSIKKLVKEKYGEIADQSKEENLSSCCGAGGCSTVDYTIMSDDYTSVEGYNEDADLGLGCGIPTTFAQIKHGDTVIDLGSGAGNDVFVARSLTGSKGKVIGVDMTPKMIEKAEENNKKLGYKNVEFRLGEIEKLPITANTADVVISNCVLNLVPNKTKAFKEMFRITMPGGHFSVSDVVLIGELPPNLKEASEMYAGCVSGAIQKGDYLIKLQQAGFEHIKVQKQKEIIIPEDILSNYMSKQEIKEYKNDGTGIFSITVFGQKPVENYCIPGSGCC